MTTSQYVTAPKQTIRQPYANRSLTTSQYVTAPKLKDMRKGLKNNKADVMKPNKHGRIAIEVTMMLGITRKVEVVTGWCIDPGKKVPRLVTAYPKKK